MVPSQEGNEGHITLHEDDPEVVRLLIEYFYLLDYEPLIPGADTSTHGDRSDTMSIRTEAGQYGNVYGTSAVSAFGGPIHSPLSFPTVSTWRERADSSLTSHAMPGNDFTHFGRPARRKTSKSMMAAAPDPSPLATSEPNLALHAKMYAAGDRYGICGLKALALDKFKIQLTRHW